MLNLNRIKMKKYIILLMIGLGLFIGCSEDLLETEPSTSTVDNLVFKTIDGAQAALNGVYNRLRMYGVEKNRTYGSYTGIKSCMDATCDDIAAHYEGGWMGGWYTQDDGDATVASGPITQDIYEMYYVVISNANGVISNVPDINANETDKNYILGQAKALRALCYFDLVRFYQHPYTVAADQLAVPYIENPEKEYKPRETVQFIYDRILEDLIDAEQLLNGFSRRSNNEIDRKVTQGLLARVYLTMEDWQNAADYARASRIGYNLMDATSFQAGFNDNNVSESIWSMSQSVEQRINAKDPFALWANDSRERIGALNTWSAKVMFADADFVALFEAGDCRNQFWRYGATDPYPDAITINRSDKFRDNVTNTPDVILMRSAEMYLIEIEALIHGASGPATALTLLNELQSTRGATLTAATLSNVKIERRKELYGEGFRWFDIIRYRETLVKDDPENYNNFTIAAYSNLFRFQIPQREIDYNPEITDNEQNELFGLWGS